VSGVCVCVLIGFPGRVEAQLATEWSVAWSQNPALQLVDRVTASDLHVYQGHKYVVAVGQVAKPDGSVVFGIMRFHVDDPIGTVNVRLWPTSTSPNEQWIPTALSLRGSEPVGGGLEENEPWIFVTGHGPGALGTRDTVTLGLTPSLDTVWAVHYNHTPPVEFHGDDIPVAIHADPADKVAVAVASEGVGTGTDIQILVYNSKSGQLIGRPEPLRISSPGLAHDIPVAVQMGASGWVHFVGNYVTPSGYRVRAWAASPPVAPAPSYSIQAHFNGISTYGAEDFANAAVFKDLSAWYITGWTRFHDQVTRDAYYIEMTHSTASTVRGCHFPDPWGNDEGLSISVDYTIHPLPLPPTPLPDKWVAVGGTRQEADGGRSGMTLLFRNPEDANGVPAVWWSSERRDFSTSNDDEGVVGIHVVPGISPREDHGRIYSTTRAGSGPSNFVWQTTLHWTEQVAFPLVQRVNAAVTQPFGGGAAGFGHEPVALHYYFDGSDRNVIVTGWSFTSANSDDFRLIRYTDVTPTPP
jgi:hypothetical protein